MTESYYDNLIENEQRKLNVTVRLLEVAMSYLVPKNNRKQNNLNNAWTKLKYAKDNKERIARLNTFLKLLNEDRAFKTRLVSSTEVSKELRNRFRGSKFELEPHEYSTYGYEIGSQAKDSVAKYVRNYVDLIRHIEQLRRNKDQDINDVQERERQVAKKMESQYSSRSEESYDSTVYANVPSSRIREAEHTVKVGDKVVFHDYDEFEVREERAIKYLEDKIATTRARGYGKFFLTTDEEKMLRSVLGDGKYLHVTGLVEDGLALQDVLFRLQQYERDSRIPFKRSDYRPNLSDVFDVAISVYRYLPEELMLPSYALDKEGRYEIKLRNMAGMDKGLETYEKIYAIYLNYFNRLEDEEKNKLKSSFMTNGAYDYYKKQFNITEFEIISPSKLKLYVNRKIKENMLDNFTTYMDNNIDHYNALTRATTYMSIEDLANLYHAMKEKYNTYATVYSGPDEQQQRDAQEERRRNLQENFVNAILRKMNLGNLSLEEKNKKIEYIVKEVLHDTLLFEVSVKPLAFGVTETHEEVREEVKEEASTIKAEDGMYHYIAGEEEQKTTNKAMAARYNAQHRFFGMSKLEQTVARMNGKWAIFKKLWDQAATMDKSEQEEVAQKLDLMFRR